jgi:hypothetical protein
MPYPDFSGIGITVKPSDLQPFVTGPSVMEKMRRPCKNYLTRWGNPTEFYILDLGLRIELEYEILQATASSINP